MLSIIAYYSVALSFMAHKAYPGITLDPARPAHTRTLFGSRIYLEMVLGQYLQIIQDIRITKDKPCVFRLYTERFLDFTGDKKPCNYARKARLIIRNLSIVLLVL